MMFVNIDAVPTGKAYYTVAVAHIDEPLSHDMPYDEVDLIASADIGYDDWGQVVNENMTEVREMFGDDVQYIGVINQSSGYVVWQHPETKR